VVADHQGGQHQGGVTLGLGPHSITFVPRMHGTLFQRAQLDRYDASSLTLGGGMRRREFITLKQLSVSFAPLAA